MSADPIVLSYNDTLLRQSDLRLLDPPNWLNDHLISFCFQYYDYELFNDSNFAFVDPDIAQLLKLSSLEELDIFLSSMDLGNKDVVFLPVNDNSSVSQVGGMHWSLLVYRKKSNEFCHYDSSSNFNHRAADLTARKLAQYLKVDVHFNADKSGSPQQRNSYDCGLYVICITEYICQLEATGAVISGKRLSDVVTAERVNKKRAELEALINELAAK